MWTAQPNPKRYSQARNDSNRVFSFIFYVLFSATLLLGCYTERPGWDSHWIFLLIPILLPILGVRHLVDPLVLRHQARSLFYAVTNRRALILKTGRKAGITSYYPADISGLTCVRHADGYGNVVVRAEPYSSGDFDLVRTYGFFGIEEPNHVEGLVRNLAPASEQLRPPAL